jgi:succinyl-CoA synthetase beta subunit
MNIHEYQGKAVLKEYGAPVSAGFPALSVAEAVEAAKKLPGPLYVVKSQIHAGGRGKGKFKELPADAKGGVRLAKSIDEVESHAKEMLGNTLVTAQTGPAGKQVNRLYIEDGSDIAKEFYLSALVDRETSRVAFVVSTEGGMDIEGGARHAGEDPDLLGRSGHRHACRIHGAPSPRRWASAATRPSKLRAILGQDLCRLRRSRTWRCSRSTR